MITVFPDGKTLHLRTTQAKGSKQKLDHGRLRDHQNMLQITVDRVYDERAKQTDVYEQVRSCVRVPFQGR